MDRDTWIIVGMGVLIIVVSFFGPKHPLFGSEPQRFQQTPSRYLMFDNKTAQDCYAGPKLGTEGTVMPDGLNGGLPFCEDLAKQ
jgi:hypothetical protein